VQILDRRAIRDLYVGHMVLTLNHREQQEQRVRNLAIHNIRMIDHRSNSSLLLGFLDLVDVHE
jgi:hypothetical protein